MGIVDVSNPGYIQFPDDFSAETLRQNAFDLFGASVPGYVPNESDLVTIAIEVLAQMDSEAASVSANVPSGIYRFLGKSLFAIPSIDASFSTMSSTWTLSDNLGHTITAGTNVNYRVDGDIQIPFQVQTDVVVPPGSTTTSDDEVVLIAVNAGSVANGLVADTMYLVDSLNWVASIVSTASSSGGVDAETDTAYLNRLRPELQLLTKRPILPNDFAVLAQDIASVGRAVAIDGYDIGQNEKQRITTTGSPTGGTFTLTYSSQTTSSIAYNASAGTIQTALEALSNIAPGDVVVTGGPLPAQVSVEFTGTLALTNVSQMTKTDSLTGGTSPATVITTTQQGAAPSSNNERTITVAIAATDGTALGNPVKTEVDDYLTALREINFIVHVIDPTYTTVNVTASVKMMTGQDAAIVEAACEAALEEYLSPASWDWAGTVYVNELIQLLANVTGVDRVVTITVPSGDLALGGIAALPVPGSFAIAVSG